MDLGRRAVHERGQRLQANGRARPVVFSGVRRRRRLHRLATSGCLQPGQFARRQHQHHLRGRNDLDDEWLRHVVGRRDGLELELQRQSECRLRRRRQHLLQNSLVAGGRGHDGQSGFDHHAQCARRGADSGRRVCRLQQWQLRRRRRHQLRRAIVGRVHRVGQSAVRRDQRDDGRFSESRALCHRRWKQLHRLFSRHHHRQQHRRQHGGTVLCRPRLRPLHRSRHAQWNQPDQRPGLAAADIADSTRRPERDQRSECRVQRHGQRRAAVRLQLAVQWRESVGRRKHFRLGQQCFVGRLGHGRQRRRLPACGYEHYWRRHQQRRGLERRLHSRRRHPADKPDGFVRRHRRFQRFGQWFDAAGLSMAQKRNEPRQRRQHLRRDEP